MINVKFFALGVILTCAAAVPTPTDGFCASYIIQGYDTCALIAQAHGITEADIEAFNVNTWAWLGCNQLYQGDFICLSAGNPPMPMALPNAVCGPQVPGTVRPSNWADLAGMNPCAESKCVSISIKQVCCQSDCSSVLHGANAAPLRNSVMPKPANRPLESRQLSVLPLRSSLKRRSSLQHKLPMQKRQRPPRMPRINPNKRLPRIVPRVHRQITRSQLLTGNGKDP